MLEAGLLDEVAALRTAGRLPAASTAARAIGYRQALDYLERRAAGDLEAGLEGYVDFVRAFRTASRNYASDQLKWYRRDAAFAVLPAGDAAALEALVDMDRASYEALLASDAQAAAHEGLRGDAKQMRTFASRPCAAEADPASHLTRAEAAVARVVATGGDAESAGPPGENAVRLADLKRRREEGG
mmetsp:Transcript_14166/g.43823  ORF Transcript_14166/g.43823 Transcript_14166/m.43823 type:complete len:186 (+) Transcript_14166:288-845(+)